MPPKPKATTTGTSVSPTEADLAQKYQKKTDKQHVLDNPDTYTGSMELTEYDTYVFNAAYVPPTGTEDEIVTFQVVPKQINIVPGLYKLFDEGIVNCRDHAVRMRQQASVASAAGTETHQVTDIRVTIAQDGTITMYNNGNGIDVAKHPEENIWIPELIFGHLRTSTNYDKTEKKIVGGKNGFGFKLVLIWSTYGRVETVDHVRGLKYVQEFSDNLNVIKPPVITKCTSKAPYTQVTFKPDYARLGLTGLSEDMLNLFKRRVYDIAAVTEKAVKVKLNDQVVPVRTFAQYVDLYIGAAKRVHEEANEHWEFAMALAPTQEFTQVSFVNGIYTAKGGKHVDYIVNQVVRKMVALIKAKKKIDVKPATIKEQLMVFVRCDIENPSFDSQTKDFLTTPSTAFGSSCEVSDKFIEKLAKLGIMDTACALTEVKDTQALKTTDGNKTVKVRGIQKLDDANYAGTAARSHECTLIICEGDSAKSGIVSGLSTEDRNYIGIYPLRGKLFNVRGQPAKRISEVKEISEIKQILGLKAGRTYTPETAKQELRYGHVVFMTDQDLDGSHIKGLCINLFDAEWDSLLSLPNFIGFMNTPIIKAVKGRDERVFYNDGQYAQWKATLGGDTKGWHIKYYKGLGTSTAKEFKEYFKEKRMVYFMSSGEASRNAIDMAFNKKRANDRKEWLATYDRHRYLDTSQLQVPYERFIQEELVHFSQKDCERSIPNMIDGLKTSQRKILYTCFKRKLVKDEVKVAQLAGSVAELSRYHHGEQSLCGAIVNMAQTFVGSNNINLLLPNGQFGTRLQGGSDAASERYIFTLLNGITRLIFPAADDHVLEYLEDDGEAVEPVYYVPIIPMLLVNGSKGIGTGFSTDIPAFDPVAICNYLIGVLQGSEVLDANFVPYYQGFKGTITPLGEKFMVKGRYEVLSDRQLRVTELPVGTWTEDFKTLLSGLLEVTETPAKKAKAEGGDEAPKKQVPLVKDYVDLSTDVDVNIVVTFAPGILPGLLSETADNGCNGVERVLKLSTTISLTNMNAFDENEKLVHYDTVRQVIEAFVPIRRAYYTKRKAHQVGALEVEATRLSNKARFIQEVLGNIIDLRHKSSSEVVAMLEARGYPSLKEDTTEQFDYLVKMPMNSVTKENVQRLQEESAKTAHELSVLRATSEDQIWLNELMALRDELKKVAMVAEKNSSTAASSEVPSKTAVKRKTKA